MFMSSMFAGAGFNNNDPDQERDPPPPATPPTFPERNAVSVPHDGWSNPSMPPKLQPIFAKVFKPSDITEAHLAILNVHIAPECEPECLLPLAPDGNSYFPSVAPDQAINAPSYADAIKVDSASADKRKAYHERLAELRVDNDTGIRVITRTPKPGTKVRLAYMRKFWEGLESVAQYWDASLDQYYEAAVTRPDHDGEKDSKRQRLNSERTMNLQTESAQADDAKPIPIPVLSQDDNIAIAASTPLPEEPNDQSCGKHLRYKGRRTATGRDMPDQFRIDMVKAFVDGTTYPFNTQVVPARQMPLVQISKLNIPVRQTAAVYRRPKDRARARAGILEGPVMTVQCRFETEFQADGLDVKQRETKARLDAIRELSGLVQQAQERQRQGKTETRPGEGQWWTTKPRWGGGQGNKLVKNEDAANGDLVKDVLQMAEEMVSNASVRRDTARRSKKKTPVMLWKELKPGSKTWDAKVDYQAIGKNPDSGYDEVFMVSSLNHHISILKLRVSVAYIEYLKSETVPNPLPEDEKWCRPELQRTKWYDLLDVEGRVQAFRALWGISSYLFREPHVTETDTGMPSP